MSLRMWRKNGPLLDTEGRRGYFDLSYGDESEEQKLDVWLPEGAGPFPAVICIHGGGYVACDKRQEDMVKPMLYGLSKGYGVISVNYRLAPKTRFPEPVKDIKQAIRFIKAHGADWGIDCSKLAVWGGSAGGYLTLMSCLFRRQDGFDNPLDVNLSQNPCVAAAVAWYPQTDFASADQELEINSLINRQLGIGNTDLSEQEYEPAFPQSEESTFPFHNRKDSVCSLFLGCNMEEESVRSSELIRQASPIGNLHDQLPPLLIQHGTKDEILPMQQSVRFAIQANRLCGEERVKLELIPGAIHSSLLFETEENLEKIFCFLDHVL